MIEIQNGTLSEKNMLEFVTILRTCQTMNPKPPLPSLSPRDPSRTPPFQPSGAALVLVTKSVFQTAYFSIQYRDGPYLDLVGH